MGFTHDHVVRVSLFLVEEPARQVEGRLHVGVDGEPVCLHLTDDLPLDPVQGLAGKALIQQPGGETQLLLGVGSLRMDDAILHFPLIDHHDDQHPVAVESQKFHLS